MPNFDLGLRLGCLKKKNKMLFIQEFIQNHPDTWEQRLSEVPYALKIKRSPFADGRYVMFNYNMLESDSYNLIVAEARGLVLDSENDFKIVRKGFNRFFNYGEGPAAKIDWNTASATIKEDGTLLFLSYYDGRWIWGTRQNFDVDEAEMSDALYPTFGALLDDVIAKHYPKFQYGGATMGQNCTWCFELCSRFNRIVIDYPEPKLFLLAKFDNDTGSEFPQYLVDADAKYMGVDRPKYYKMSSVDDYAQLVEGFGIQHEGVVVLDGKGDRIKMKSKLYFEMHKQVSNGAMDVEAMVGLIRRGEDAEFLSYFPDYAEKFAKVRKHVQDAFIRIQQINHACDVGQRNITRKDFALEHVKDPLAVLWFKAYDGKLTDDFVEAITDEKFVKMFNIS